MISKLADSFRETVSGDKSGAPKWVQQIRDYSTPGLYGADSVVWQVHGSVATLIGGIRALLLQAAHPAALAGVMDHSRYKEDLMGRLQGTSRWLTLTTFGSKELIEQEARRVNAMHSKVEGRFHNKVGIESEYRASNERFLLWVHCAFTESFLEAHRICRYPLKGSFDQYVAEWSKSAEPLGLQHAPQSEAELTATITDFMKNELTYTEATKEVVGFILKPPFGLLARIFYKPLAYTAVRSLSNAERELLQLKQPSIFWEDVARFNLWALRKGLGKHSPAQQAAIERENKIGGDEEI